MVFYLDYHASRLHNYYIFDEWSFMGLYGALWTEPLCVSKIHILKL